jgi:hypothetical protein
MKEVDITPKDVSPSYAMERIFTEIRDKRAYQDGKWEGAGRRSCLPRTYDPRGCPSGRRHPVSRPETKGPLKGLVHEAANRPLKDTTTMRR